MEDGKIYVTGTHIHYYIVCERKLWYFMNGIQMEFESDKVLEGKANHEKHFKNKQNKELLIDSLIKVDFMGDYVGEIKSSDKMQKADKMQLLYYLYFLKKAGIEKKGKIHYIKSKKVEEVILTKEDEKEIEMILTKVSEIKEREIPPKLIKKSFCKKCSYFGFCWVGEGE